MVKPWLNMVNYTITMVKAMFFYHYISTMVEDHVLTMVSQAVVQHGQPQSLSEVSINFLNKKISLIRNKRKQRLS